MGSPCEVRLYAPEQGTAQQGAKIAIDEVQRLEKKYSRYRDDSITAQINSGKKLKIDGETAGLLDYADLCYQHSEGLFDITAGVLRRAWNFKSQILPKDEAINETLPLIGWSKVHWNKPYLELPIAGMEVDFGGYVKEYAADSAAIKCRQAGFAHGLVDLGGDISIIGPHPDDSPWRVGIRHPYQADNALATIHILQGGLASSGDYERGMTVNGKRYAHILNPLTGWPVENGFIAVSVMAEQCLIAGTSSTIAMLKGADEGAIWLESLELPHVWMDAQGQVGGALATQQ